MALVQFREESKSKSSTHIGVYRGTYKVGEIVDLGNMCQFNGGGRRETFNTPGQAKAWAAQTLGEKPKVLSEARTPEERFEAHQAIEREISGVIRALCSVEVMPALGKLPSVMLEDILLAGIQKLIPDAESPDPILHRAKRLMVVASMRKQGRTIPAAFERPAKRNPLLIAPEPPPPALDTPPPPPETIVAKATGNTLGLALTKAARQIVETKARLATQPGAPRPPAPPQSHPSEAPQPEAFKELFTELLAEQQAAEEAAKPEFDDSPAPVTPVKKAKMPRATKAKAAEIRRRLDNGASFKQMIFETGYSHFTLNKIWQGTYVAVDD